MLLVGGRVCGVWRGKDQVCLKMPMRGRACGIQVRNDNVPRQVRLVGGWVCGM